MRRILTLLLTFLFVFVLLQLVTLPALAFENPVSIPYEDEKTTPSGIPLSEIESRIDAVVAKHILQSTPGAAIAVIKDGEIIFSKGYGYADIENQTPVDPASTIFEYGSIGKTFVWVSVLQLVEQGRLDLDVDIRNYLPDDFSSQSDFKMPFTMRDIMNHAAGFADYPFDLLLDAKKVKNEIPLREGLLLGQPKQIYKPGTVSAYSNYATALAGYVVEHISGQEYAVYEKENVYKPAGMTQTRNQPDWFNDHEYFRTKAKGYAADGKGGFKEGIWSYSPLFPCGADNGTAEDLARFVIALTPPQDTVSPFFAQQGTLTMMFTPSALDQSTLRGTNHGLFSLNGFLPTFGHGGNSASFSTIFAVTPSERFGFVALTNTESEFAFISDIHNLLMGASALPSVVGSLPNAANVEGYYVDMRRFEGTFCELFNYLSLAKVSAIDDNSIRIDFGPFSAAYQQIGHHVYRLIKSDHPMYALIAYELHFKMENGIPVQILAGNGFDLSVLPKGRSFPFLMGSQVVLAGSAVFFLIMPIILFIGFLRKREKSLSRFHLFSNGLLLCGTMVVLNIAILLVRLLAISLFRSFAEVAPHIWANYALLALAVIMLIASVFSLKGSGVKTKRKVLYGITLSILTLLFFVFWKWNFFLIL